MRAVSLWRPWPYWIAMGIKTIETRPTWLKLPKYMVGERLAIHAAQKVDNRAVAEASMATGKEIDVPREYEDAPTGLICHVLVEAVRRLNGLIDSASALCRCQGMVGIVLTDIVRLDPPVRYKGHQGPFYVPDHLLGLDVARDSVADSIRRGAAGHEEAKR